MPWASPPVGGRLGGTSGTVSGKLFKFPRLEMWDQGIHARSCVTCADCHMPYKREGALKICDHHNPLLSELG